MPTMVDRLLETADELLRRRGRSGAARRRAVSTAYYAVFHRLAKLCTESLLGNAPIDSDEYARVYRALQHGAAKQAFDNKALQASDAAKIIGDAFAQLQSEREKADYSPPLRDLFSLKGCEELITLARKACNTVDGLSPAEGRLMTTVLLFKARKP